MRFFLGDDLLDHAPNYMVALVVARFAAPPDEAGRAWAEGLLRDAVAALPAALAPGPAGADAAASRLRDDPRVAAWRAAFTGLGLNPNRYPSSVEALAGRALKGGAIPSATTLVDVANAVALRHLVPAGAHDLDTLTSDLGVRLSRAGDTFVTRGQVETLPPGEPVYVSGAEVRTRRWVWRQSDVGRLTPQSAHILFPVDGFRGQTDAAVLAAAQSLMDSLSTWVPRSWRCIAWTPIAARSIWPEPGARPGDPQSAGDPGPTRDTHPYDQFRAGPRRPARRGENDHDCRTCLVCSAPAVRTDDEGIREVLERGVEIIEVRADLERELRSGRRLRVKLGIDPTGRASTSAAPCTLRKMRQFQRLGHQAVLIVGDLTAQVGDASDKNEERPHADRGTGAREHAQLRGADGHDRGPRSGRVSVQQHLAGRAQLQGRDRRWRATSPWRR